MNVIVANEQQSKLLNLDCDVIKNITGVYSANEIVEMFKNFFYSKMILDVTALKNHTELTTYEELSQGLDVEKIIFLLPEGSSLCTSNFLSHLITIGIYNFTTNIEGIKFLLKKSNTLQDVEHIQKISQNNNNNFMNNNEVGNNNNNFNNEFNQSNNMNFNNNNMNNNMNFNNNMNNNMNFNNGMNFNNNNMNNNMNSNNSYYEDGNNNSFLGNFNNNVQMTVKPNNQATIIGVKNVTEGAGATTFIYMLKRELTTIYGKNNVVCFEVNKKDFQIFNDEHMISVSQTELQRAINQYGNAQIILVDLNNTPTASLCNDIFYLIEPSTIKLNKLIKRNKIVFQQLHNNKIILNKSLLTSKDVSDFESEAGIRVYYNMPPLDERKRNGIINDFLVRVGLIGGNGNNGNKIFGLFRR